MIPGSGGLRQNPKFGAINNFFNGANANYNALQASFRKRFNHGFTFNAQYSWSHALDQGGVSNGPASATVQDDFNLHNEYGNADYDVRRYLQFDYTYQLPGLPAIPKAIGGGWQINGLTVMRSGLPYIVFCACDPVGIGNFTGRPDLVPGVSPFPSNFDLPNNQLNLAAFRTPVGRFGNLGRNVFNGPSAYKWDFSLFKNFRFRESQGVQFRAEMFNIFNTRPIFESRFHDDSAGDIREDPDHDPGRRRIWRQPPDPVRNPVRLLIQPHKERRRVLPAAALGIFRHEVDHARPARSAIIAFTVSPR